MSIYPPPIQAGDSIKSTEYKGCLPDDKYPWLQVIRIFDEIPAIGRPGMHTTYIKYFCRNGINHITVSNESVFEHSRNNIIIWSRKNDE